MTATAAEEFDGVAILVWCLRLIVPCVLFWISFGPRICTAWPWQGPAHSRTALLSQRRVVLMTEGEERHEALRTFLMVDETSAPSLFQDRKKERSESERRERRERGDRGDRGDDGDRGEVRERGDRGDRTSKEERRERRERRSDFGTTSEELKDAELEQDPERERARKAAEAEEALKKVEREKQMHTESLVNFVAFNRYKQQRHFLFGEERPPPPPPERAPSATSKETAPQAHCVTFAAAERANAEAQMVLKGMLIAKACMVSVTRGLYHQLNDLNVEIAIDTFELMVQACVQAKDLPATSACLMHMEDAGHVPSSELLDRVMDLYLHHKKGKDGTKPTLPAATAGVSSASQAPPLLPQNGSTAVGPMVPQALPPTMGQHGGVGPSPPPPPPPPPSPPPVDAIYLQGAGFHAAPQAMSAHGTAMGMGIADGGGVFGGHAGVVGMQQMPVSLMYHPTAQGVPAAVPRQGGGIWHDAQQQHARMAVAPKMLKASDKSLPAFSIPDEFVAKKECADAALLSNGEFTADAESPPASSEVVKGLGNSGLRADAAIFVPNGVAVATAVASANCSDESLGADALPAPHRFLGHATAIATTGAAEARAQSGGLDVDALGADVPRRSEGHCVGGFGREECEVQQFQ